MLIIYICDDVSMVKLEKILKLRPKNWCINTWLKSDQSAQSAQILGTCSCWPQRSFEGHLNSFRWPLNDLLTIDPESTRLELSNDIYHVRIWKNWFYDIFWCTSSKMASEWSWAQKKLQILKAKAFSFPMIYNMSGYEKIDFMSFFDVRALKWLQNGPEGFKQWSKLVLEPVLNGGR